MHENEDTSNLARPCMAQARRLRQLGDTTEKAVSSLKDAELLKQFKEIDQLPEEEKKKF